MHAPTRLASKRDLPFCLCLCALCPALNVLLMAVLARMRDELRLGERGRCSFLSTCVSMGVSHANSKSLPLEVSAKRSSDMFSVEPRAL